MICMHLSGCSYLYNLHLTGVVLRASDQSPITAGEVTLLFSGTELRKCPIGSDGAWTLLWSESNVHYRKDDQGVLWFEEDELTLRIDVGGKSYEIPCPPAVGSTTGLDFYAYVLAAIDIPVTKESPIAK